QLINRRKEFDGTNVEFCRRHGISMTSFYKHQASIRSRSTNNFIQVKTTTEQTRFESHAELQFDVRSGTLTLPMSLPVEQVVAIVRGLLR
ncbi:IS66 family insertion sequence hypothetical protein, partial [Pseudoalteromonas ruthenica]